MRRIASFRLWNDRDRIEPGYNADLVLVDEHGEFPRVGGTIRQGVPIYWDSHLANLSQLGDLFVLDGQQNFPL